MTHLGSKKTIIPPKIPKGFIQKKDLGFKNYMHGLKCVSMLLPHLWTFETLTCARRIIIAAVRLNGRKIVPIFHVSMTVHYHHRRRSFPPRCRLLDVVAPVVVAVVAVAVAEVVVVGA